MAEDLFIVDKNGVSEETLEDNDLGDLLYVDKSRDSNRNNSEIIYETGVESAPLGSKEERINETAAKKPMGKRLNIPRHANKRYHEMDDLNEKFKPGVLSDELRTALGIEDNQLSLHTYRMRHLGYPPGWLKKAEVKGSDLSIINSTDPDSDAEKKIATYNFDDIIVYPGFNDLPEPHIIDQWQSFGSIPLQKDHLIDNFKQILLQSGYVPAESQDVHNQTKRSRIHNDIDSDLSLIDLEKEKQRLLAELEHDTNDLVESDEDIEAPVNVRAEDITSTSTEVSLPVSVSLVETSTNAVLSTTDDAEAQINTTIASDEVSSTIDLPLSTNGVTKSTEDSCNLSAVDIVKAEVHKAELAFGSPVFNTINAIKQLPSCNNFNEGIFEFLPYENLPNSQGTFLRVNDALRRGRESLKSGSNLSSSTPSSTKLPRKSTVAITSTPTSAQSKSDVRRESMASSSLSPLQSPASSRQRHNTHSRGSPRRYDERNTSSDRSRRSVLQFSNSSTSHHSHSGSHSHQSNSDSYHRSYSNNSESRESSHSYSRAHSSGDNQSRQYQSNNQSHSLLGNESHGHQYHNVSGGAQYNQSYGHLGNSGQFGMHYDERDLHSNYRSNNHGSNYPQRNKYDSNSRRW